jgi:hypothetical protein
MKKLLQLVILLSLAVTGKAACHAVGPTSTGAGTGADWNNQMAVPSSAGWVRGDSYYFADGSYGASLSLHTADSGTTVIELRKAQSYDFGSGCGIGAGWNTSTMGSSQASWAWASAGSMVSITTDYWKINGNGVNVGTTNIGCGGVFASPPTWTTNTYPNSQLAAAPTPSDCGILIDASPCTGAHAVTSTGGCDGGNGEMHISGHDITWDSTEWKGAGINQAGNNNSETYFCFCSNPANNSYKHMYGHNAATTYVTNSSGGWSNGIFEYNYLWSVFDGSTNHGEAIQETGTDSNTTIAWNIFRDMGTNGWFFVAVDPVTGTHTNFQIIGNVGVCSSGNSCRSSDGIFACINASQTCTNIVLSQNTMIGNFTNNAGIVTTNACSGCVAQNNLWYLTGSSLSGISVTAFSQDHNSFLDTTGSSGTGNVNVASGAPNPFVNWTAGNYNLISDSADWNSRVVTANDPLTDLYGNTFTTDRGAAQFTHNTWFIRTDGGTRYSTNVTTGQCNGLYDASYASTGGTGVNQNCAYNDFRYMWDDHSGTVGIGSWVAAGGDTVVIRGCAAIVGGTRPQVNPSNPDCRLGWDAPTGYNPPAWCYAVGNTGCINPPVPSGTSGAHTRILGGCAYDSTPGPCNTGNVTNIANLTQLFTGFGLTFGFSLRGSNYVDIQGIEFTTHNKVGSGTAFAPTTAYTVGQHIFDGTNTEWVTTGGTSGGSTPSWAAYSNTSIATTVSGGVTFSNYGPNCTSFGSAPTYPVGCIHGSQPYDDFGANGFYTSNATANILFQDVYIHGMSSAGFYGAIGGAITMTRVTSSMNAFAGWDFDEGTGGPNSTGFPDNPLASIVASYVTMDWNGCNEEYPVVDTIPIVSCYSIINGGFGDAWSGQNTHFASFTGSNLEIANNVKDAFFGPHTSIGAVTVTNSYAANNGGQTWKFNLGGTGTWFMQNVVTDGNCRRLAQPFTGMPATFYNGIAASDYCRADGATFSGVVPVAGSFEVDNSTFVSASDNVAYDLSCWSNAGAIAPNLGGTGYVVNDVIYIGSNVTGTVTSVSAGGVVTGLSLIQGANVTTTSNYNEVYTYDLTTPTASGLTVSVSSLTAANCQGGPRILRNNNFIGYTNPSNVSWNGQTIAPFCYSSCQGTPGTFSDASWTIRSNNNFWSFRAGSSGNATYPGETTADPLMLNEPSQTWTSETQLDPFNPHTTNNSFYPTSASPLVGTGTTYTGIPTNDYFGIVYSNPPPIGGVMQQGSIGLQFSGKINFSGKVTLTP